LDNLKQPISPTTTDSGRISASSDNSETSDRTSKASTPDSDYHATLSPDQLSSRKRRRSEESLDDPHELDEDAHALETFVEISRDRLGGPSPTESAATSRDDDLDDDPEEEEEEEDDEKFDETEYVTYSPSLTKPMLGDAEDSHRDCSNLVVDNHSHQHYDESDDAEVGLLASVTSFAIISLV